MKQITVLLALALVMAFGVQTAQAGVKEVIQTALDGIAAVFNNITDVRRVFMENVTDGIENPSDGTNDVEYRQTMDFLFWYYRV